ncbi:uncharacterized protein LOC109800371 [Cajanus cajan]|uniref:DUF4408 domain-containing protein n=1 Tax=Cajanus cajan TaxID=3821 RepID=A0A151TGH0_CAJCA|nr:uncharacterized protein LOC109800371 [Cajanus cajan]KYP66086.1 hypothetical protein KK1_012370 [Cajanus cajan]
MDSFSFNNLQAEKANAILKHRKLQRVASLLRILEVCAVLVLVSRVSMHLPVALRNSGEYFRDLSLFMHSPRFVFFVGNVIIITLFAQFSAQGSARNLGEQNLYQEFVHNSAKDQRHVETVVVAECGKKKQRIRPSPTLYKPSPPLFSSSVSFSRTLPPPPFPRACDLLRCCGQTPDTGSVLQGFWRSPERRTARRA